MSTSRRRAPFDGAFKSRRLSDRVRYGPEFADVLVKKIKPVIGFVRIDRQFVRDRDHLWRFVLTDAVQLHVHAAKGELEDRSDPLYPFDHTRSDRCQQKLSGIESVKSAVHVGVEHDRRFLRVGFAAVAVDAMCRDTIFKQRRLLLLVWDQRPPMNAPTVH